MITAEAMLPPLSRIENLDRLDLLDIRDWDEVHDSIQSILAALDSTVARGCSGVSIRPGRNSARAWELFSYRVYQSTTRPEIDAVVVGIVCARTGQCFTLHGDIAGENRGDILFEATDKEVIGKLAVIEASRDLAELLAKQSEIVAAAVADGNRRID